MPRTTEQRISVHVDGDGMRAEMRVPAVADSEMPTARDCLAALCEAGVLITPEVEAAVAEYLADRAKPDAEAMLVLRGKPPVHGKHGTFAWAEGYDPTEHQASTDEDGSIDFYEANRFITVEVGDVIATITPPTIGKPGVDLRGTEVPAKSGEPTQTKLPTGIIEEDEKGQCIAQQAGVLVCNGSEVTISPILDIRSAVDFSTGNIRFAGDVMIREGIRDRFTVEATRSIEVGGLIEAATIRAGLDLVVKGGIAMRETGSITIGRDIHTRYLNGVKGTIKGDAYIESEIIGSELAIGGDLQVRKGTIIGGTTAVTGAVKSRFLGSDGELATELSLSRHVGIEQLLAEIDRRLTALDKRLEELEEESERLQSMSDPSAVHRERMTELMCLPFELEEQKKDLLKKREALVVKYQSVRRVDVRVAEVINAGVTMIFNQTVARFTSAVSGPIWIGWNHERKPIYRLGQSPTRLLRDLPGVKVRQRTES